MFARTGTNSGRHGRPARGSAGSTLALSSIGFSVAMAARPAQLSGFPRRYSPCAHTPHPFRHARLRQWEGPRRGGSGSGRPGGRPPPPCRHSWSVAAAVAAGVAAFRARAARGVEKDEGALGQRRREGREVRGGGRPRPAAAGSWQLTSQRTKKETRAATVDAAPLHSSPPQPPPL